MSIWYHGHPLTSTENSTEIVPGEPIRRGGLLNARGVTLLDLSRAISRKRCKIGSNLVLITNRKSYMTFRLVPKSVTWMTLNGVMALLRYFTESVYDVVIKSSHSLSHLLMSFECPNYYAKVGYTIVTREITFCAIFAIHNCWKLGDQQLNGAKSKIWGRVYEHTLLTVTVADMDNDFVDNYGRLME